MAKPIAVKTSVLLKMIGRNKMDVKPISHRIIRSTVFVLLLSILMLFCVSCNQEDTIDMANNVTAEADTDGKVTVNWESVLMTRDLVGYVVYWSTDSQFGEENTSSAEVSADTYSYVIYKLKSGEWYIGVKGKFLRTYSGGTQEIQLGPLSDIIEIEIPQTVNKSDIASVTAIPASPRKSPAS